MTRVGVLGGSFNPVHWGHLHIALLAREAAGLEAVLYLPASTPPHKPAGDLAPAADRWAMLERALAAEPFTSLCNLELSPDGPRYTVDTLDRLHREHPDWDLYFILGADSLAELSTWKDPRRLVDTYDVIAVNRPGGTMDVPVAWRNRVLVVNGNPFAISSSAIRERLAAGRSIRHLVPAAVAAYIAEHHLYRPPSVRNETQ
jgi:nicotinate-nucleotide adenylyltransferase